MKVLVLGASSYTGARIYFDLQKDFQISGTFHTNSLSNDFVHLDITDQSMVKEVLATQKPDVIVHAANNANARWCEANPQEAVLINEKSSEYTVDAANEIGAKIVYISSYAAFNPSNVYAKTKLNSEEITKNTKAGWTILRPSFILGYSPNTTNDRPFNRLLKNLDEGTPAIYDNSWKFQTTYLRHLSEVTTEVIKREIYRENITVAIPELHTRYETARDILTPFGIKVEKADTKDEIPVVEDKLEKLKGLNLPNYSYDEMVENIIQEIKDRDKFVL